MDQLSLLFNEAEVYADKAAEADDGSVAVAAHKRHKKHEYTLDHLPENVPVEVVEHRLPEEELTCPECGGAHRDAEICDGQSVVPAGAGIESTRRPLETADHVQLADLGIGASAHAGL